MKVNTQTFLEGTNGKAVMLMHGITSGASQMIPMARFLGDYGYTVRCVNIAGHGTYPQDLLHTTAEDMLAKAEYDYQMLQREYDKVFVGGLSTGGLLSMLLCAKFPQIAGFISMAAPIALVPGTFITQPYPAGTVFVHRSMAGKTGLFAKYHIHYEEIAVCIFDELGKLMARLADQELLGSIRCPGLVVQAKNDDIAEPSSADYLLEHLGSEKKEGYRPATGGHIVVLSEERLEVFRRVLAFLESV